MAFKGDKSIAGVPAGLDPQLTAYLQTLAEQVNRLTGVLTGDNPFRAVRLKEIRDGSLSVVTGQPGAAELTSRTLKAPKNLQAYNLAAFIRLTWENVETEYSHVEIWCAVNSQYRDDATLVGVATKPATEFIHNAISTHDSHAYWIRAVAWTGAYSPWAPPQDGGVLVPEDTSATFNELLAKLFSDAGYTSEHVIVADSFKIVQPGVAGLTVPKTVFGVGNIDGVATMCLAGNMIVDGTVLARMIAADAVTADKIGANQINAGHILADAINGTHINAMAEITLDEGGKLTVGDQNVVLSSVSNSVIVAPDGGASANDYAELKDGNVSFFLYDPNTSAHQLYKALSRMEFGTAESDDVVEIPGLFKSRPIINLSPSSIRTYDPANNAAAQSFAMALRAMNVAGETVEEFATRRWRFQPYIELQTAAGGEYVLAGSSSTDIGAYTEYGLCHYYLSDQDPWTTWYTLNIPAGQSKIVVDFDIQHAGNYEEAQEAGCGGLSPRYVWGGWHIGMEIKLDGVQKWYSSGADGQPVVPGRKQLSYNLDPASSHTLVWRGGLHGDAVDIIWGTRLRMYSAVRTQAAATAIGTGTINWTAIGE